MESQRKYYLLLNILNYLAMGIYEDQEWLFDVIVEKFSEITGLRSGIEEDTMVYTKNAAVLWSAVTKELNIKTPFVRNLTTIEDYVHEFSSILKKHNAQRKEFMLQLQKFIADKFGHTYAPDEVLCSELEPKSIDEKKATKLEQDQYLREEMAFHLKVDKIKEAVRKEYNDDMYKTSFFYARTINQLTDVLFGKEYPVL